MDADSKFFAVDVDTGAATARDVDTGVTTAVDVDITVLCCGCRQ